MLASKFGLKGTKNFERVEREGTLFQSESFGIAYFKREDKDVSKFGFIVSNKISGESTLRNRAKRALKEAVRFNTGYLKDGYDVVFLAKTQILRKPTDAIMKEVEVSLREAGLYK